MAEFQEVMRQYQRMCKGRECKNCPIGISSIKDCFCRNGYISELGHFEETEEIVMLWAAENPEPVYPTWGEYLHTLHNEPSSRELSKPIPDNIAQKLGLQPKEVDRGT